jgi:hypothetical protein
MRNSRVSFSRRGSTLADERHVGELEQAVGAERRRAGIGAEPLEALGRLAFEAGQSVVAIVQQRAAGAR